LPIDISSLKAVFNPRLRPMIGLDISSTAVRMVELVDAGGGQPRVERYAIESLPKDVVVDGDMTGLEAITETIQRCWKRLGTSTRNVAMAVPTSAVITKKIVLPADLREQEMMVQVESEANQYLPFPLEEVNLDFQIIGPAPSGPEEVEVLLAASRKEKVEDRVAAAEMAELKPLVMDVESYAIQAAYELVVRQLPHQGQLPIVALIDIGATTTKVTIMKGDQQLYAREQAFGGRQLTEAIMRAYGASAEEAENMKRSNTPPENYATEVLHPYVEAIAQEVGRALQFFFTSTPHHEVNHIVLAGGGVLVPGAVESVIQRTGINALLADPFAGMAISPRIRAKQLAMDAPSLMVACGLALRKFDR
jgi:type IV pilus assembly protein PilM